MPFRYRNSPRCWRDSRTKGRPACASEPIRAHPALIRSPGGVEQIVGFTGTRMVGLCHAKRELLWEFPFKARYEQTIVTPVVWKDLVIIAVKALHTETAARQMPVTDGTG